MTKTNKGNNKIIRFNEQKFVRNNCVCWYNKISNKKSCTLDRLRHIAILLVCNETWSAILWRSKTGNAKNTIVGYITDNNLVNVYKLQRYISNYIVT